MGLFGKGKIEEDIPENTGLVTVGVEVNRKDRQERSVKVTIVEQDTDETVFKANYSDKKSNSDLYAKTKAERIAQLYCDENDYIIAGNVDNVKDVAIVQTVEKRFR